MGIGLGGWEGPLDHLDAIAVDLEGNEAGARGRKLHLTSEEPSACDHGAARADWPALHPRFVLVKAKFSKTKKGKGECLDRTPDTPLARAKRVGVYSNEGLREWRAGPLALDLVVAQVILGGAVPELYPPALKAAPRAITLSGVGGNGKWPHFDRADVMVRHKAVCTPRDDLA